MRRRAEWAERYGGGQRTEHFGEQRAVVTQSVSGEKLIFTAWLFVSLAICLAIGGLWRMYSYSTNDKFVGGDAFNYIVLATRGVGLICAGILCGGIAGVLALIAIWEQRTEVVR
jgi:hypothetical protein